MKLKYWSFASALVLVFMSSCQPKPSPKRAVSDFVDELIHDRSAAGHQLLASFDPRDPAGDIVVFGPSDEVRSMSRALLSSDRFDNVDARPVRDLLPDFSGEVITQVVMSNPEILAGYGNDQGASLRELTVKAVLTSLDTLSFRTPSDLSSFSHKSRGKIVVMTSSAMAAYGKYDVDSLMRAFGLGSAVFFPFDLMADKALSKPESRIGIVSPKPQSLYDEYFGYRDDAGSHYIGTFSGESVLDPLTNIADSLALDVLLLDDPAVEADSLRALFPKVEVIDPASVTAQACYRAMRSRNIFTHRVAYPRWAAYSAVPSEDLQYILIDSDDRELF